VQLAKKSARKVRRQLLHVRYYQIRSNASVGPSNDWWGGSSTTYSHGFQGPQLNYQYMIDKNIDLMLWASSLTPTDGSSGKLRTVKFDIDFFF
jgi:hypothetical protein